MTAKEELLEEMRDTSELCVFAQWLMGLEFILWDALESRNRVFPGSMGGEIDIGRLSDLSAKCGGWWIWDEESSAEKFVTLAEWEAIRKERNQRSIHCRSFELQRLVRALFPWRRLAHCPGLNAQPVIIQRARNRMRFMTGSKP